jgi:hypothetical protein
MPEAVSATLVMYADDTSFYTVGETVEESKKKLEIAAQEIMKYMEENYMHLRASKTEYMLFGRNGGGSIKVRSRSDPRVKNTLPTGIDNQQDAHVG